MAPPNLDRRKRQMPSNNQPQQAGPVGQQQAPDTSIRGMANEQYRNALLRRVGGGQQSAAPQPTGEQPVAPEADALKNMLRTRNSRRVLRAGQS